MRTGAFRGAKRVVADLDAAGLLEKVAEHTHAWGHATVAAPLSNRAASTQWFVKMKPLQSLPSLRRARRHRDLAGKRRSEYFEWMRNIRRLVHLSPAVVGAGFPRGLRQL